MEEEMKKSIIIGALLLLTVTLLSADFAHAQHQKRMRDRKTLGLIFNRNEPDNTLDQDYDNEYGSGIKVGYGLTDEVGLQLAFTNYKFDGKSTVGALDSLSIDNIRANALYRFITSTNLYPFATAGLGYYMVEEGGDDFGFNFGLGIITDLVDFHEMWSLDLSWNYHRIFNKGKDAAFFEIRLGLDFNFY
jgi:opacity protein-like surface antigen